MNIIELPISYGVVLADELLGTGNYTVLYKGVELHNVAGIIIDNRLPPYHEDSTTTK